MKKTFFLLSVLLFLSSCASNEEKAYKEVYSLAKKEISARLLSPLSAQFQDLKDIRKLYGEKDSIESCWLTIEVNSQNAFGAMLVSRWDVVARRHITERGNIHAWDLEVSKL